MINCSIANTILFRWWSRTALYIIIPLQNFSFILICITVKFLHFLCWKKLLWLFYHKRYFFVWTIWVLLHQHKHMWLEVDCAALSVWTYCLNLILNFLIPVVRLNEGCYKMNDANWILMPVNWRMINLINCRGVINSKDMRVRRGRLVFFVGFMWNLNELCFRFSAKKSGFLC